MERGDEAGGRGQAVKLGVGRVVEIFCKRVRKQRENGGSGERDGGGVGG